MTPTVPTLARPALGRASRAVRTGVTASAELSVTRGPGGRQRIHWSHAWPVVLRPTGEDRVHLVHGAGGPLGGDALALDVDVGPGALLRVRSAGATIVQPGTAAGPARWDTTVAVGAGGTVDWAPEPTVVVDGAVFETSLNVDLAPDACAVVRDVVVLGRHGRLGGRCRGRLTVTVHGQPLLVHTTVLDGADAALAGPGGSGGARAVGTVVLAGRSRPGRADDPDGAGERSGVRWAWTTLDGPGRLLLAVGEPGPVTALLDDMSPGSS